MKSLGNRGFSLIEVLLASALLGGLALTLAKFTQDQMKSTKTVETKFEHAAILNEIRQILGNNASCMATLGGRNANSTAPNIIFNIRKALPNPPGGNIDRFTAEPNGNGPSYGNGLVKIISFHLDASLPPAALGPTNSGTTNLVITFSFGSKDRTYISSTTKTILLNVDTVDATDRTITDCSSSGNTASEFVQRAGDSMFGPLVMEGPTHIEMQEGSYIDFTSDERLKYDVKNIDDSLTKLKNLRPVSFKWKSNDHFDYGFIAQEMKNPYPTLVKENSEGYLSVNYIQLIPHLVKSIQILDAENKSLRKELKNMQAEQKKMNRKLNSRKD